MSTRSHIQKKASEIELGEDIRVVTHCRDDEMEIGLERKIGSVGEDVEEEHVRRENNRHRQYAEVTRTRSGL
ncbi:MAG: hypothetical protein SXQ77_12495, partial [Halobacteria archaeon]|nr:hypothetical protein [Halobacteria archaeon]